jgi:hypothetical protein
VLCEGVVTKWLAPEPDWRSDGGSSAMGSGDVTSQRTTVDAMTQGGRRTRGHPCGMRVVTGGRRSGGNCGGNASEHAAKEDLGEKVRQEGPGCQRLRHACGNGLASCVGVGWGRCRARPAAEKTVCDDFSILNSFSN